jgi:thymidylate kinase
VALELVGIPGSGKSRRARLLAERLARRDVRVAQPAERVGPSVPTGRRLARKAAASTATAIREPATAVRVLRGIVASGQPGHVAGRLVQWLVAEDVGARAARGHGVSIVDEGLVQALWSVGLRGDVRPVLRALDHAGRQHAAGLLVVVRVPPEVALARLLGRRSQHSRVQLLEERQALAELERGAHLLDLLVDWWQGTAPTGRGAVVTLDGTTDDGPDHAGLLDRVCAAVATPDD